MVTTYAGVAPLPLTFLASPRKVSKRRRPRAVGNIGRPSGSLRFSQARATRKTRARGWNWCSFSGCARPQTLLADGPRVCCAAQRRTRGSLAGRHRDKWVAQV